MIDETTLYRVAELYYIQGATMESVADRLSVSRSTVSRMLQTARDQGIVRISLSNPSNTRSELAEMLSDTFGVTAHVAGTSASASDTKRLEAAARYAAVLVSDRFGNGMTLAVAWGITTSAVASYLQPKRTQGTTVVQMNGAVSARTPHMGHSPELLTEMAAAFDSSLIPFPTPAFFDNEQTRRLMWAESTVRRVLSVRNSADLALFSIGSFQGSKRSEVYSGGYLTEAAFKQFAAQRVVGDVCTVFLREDGTYADIDLNRRASGPTPMELRQIPSRLCVVAGDQKVPGLVGALRAGVVTDLVIDEITAQTLMRRINPLTKDS